MASKPPKYTKYPHHKWRWVGNNTQGYLSKTITRVTKKAFTSVSAAQQKKENRNDLRTHHSTNGRG